MTSVSLPKTFVGSNYRPDEPTYYEYIAYSKESTLVHGNFKRTYPFEATFKDYEVGKMEQRDYNVLFGWLHSVRPYDLPSITSMGVPRWGSLTADINNSQNSAIANLSKAEFNLANAIGELPDTINMVSKRVNQFADYASGVKNRDPKAAVKHLRDANGGIPSVQSKLDKLVQRIDRSRRYHKWLAKNPVNLYLETIFGWMPLASDIYDGAMYLHKASNDAPVSKRIITSRGGNSFATTRNGPWNSSYVFGITNEQITTTRSTRSVVKWLWTHPQQHKTAKELGFLNPVLVAWELKPLSFVIDSFLPIGDFIQGFTPRNGLVYYDGYTTTKDESVYSAKPAGSPGKGKHLCTKVAKLNQGSVTRSRCYATPNFPMPTVPRKLEQALSYSAIAFKHLSNIK